MNRFSTATTGFRAVATAWTVMLAGLSAWPGEAAARSWSTSGSYERIVISDCRDCDEDTGIMIACQAAGQPAEVTVHWAAVENGREGAILPIDFDISGQFFSFQATTRYFGLTGYTPQFQLYPGHPMIEAMQAGQTARVSFAGRSVEISLRGSRDTFDIFKAHCGWNNVNVQPTAPQVVGPSCPAGFILSQGQCVRTGPPTPVPSTGQFTIFHGYDLFGGDYAKLPGRVSYDKCVSACQGDRQCRAFTYNTQVSACFLKSRVPGRTPFQNAISGVRR